MDVEVFLDGARHVARYQMQEDGSWLATCPEVGDFQVRHDTMAEAKDVMHILIKGVAGEDARIEDRVL